VLAEEVVDLVDGGAEPRAMRLRRLLLVEDCAYRLIAVQDYSA
jgi:hypothetical protein